MTDEVIASMDAAFAHLDRDSSLPCMTLTPEEVRMFYTAIRKFNNSMNEHCASAPWDVREAIKTMIIERLHVIMGVLEEVIDRGHGLQLQEVDRV